MRIGGDRDGSQCCPLIVCVLDWAFLGRRLPSLRSTFALLVVASGCAGYVLTDRAFKLSGWSVATFASGVPPKWRDEYNPRYRGL